MLSSASSVHKKNISEKNIWKVQYSFAYQWVNEWMVHPMLLANYEVWRERAWYEEQNLIFPHKALWINKNQQLNDVLFTYLQSKRWKTHDPGIYSDSSRWTWKGFAWSGLRNVATFYGKLNVFFWLILFVSIWS